MRLNRKGSELSMNVIIIAAIALLVLVILAVMLLQKSGDLKEGTSCEGLGGECCHDCGTGDCQDYGVHSTAQDSSCRQGQQCCLKIGDSQNP